MIINGDTYINQKIVLDGKSFRDCIFQNCILIYGGGQLSMVGNKLFGVKWEFVDAAARTLGLISSFYQSGDSSKIFVEELLSTFGKGNDTST